ncbi:MAG: hypothetical protein PHR50_14055, partial [Lachnospiraceae bacterium]|nr:hypothetical protein [Lachnospiraceae bacterium]
QNSHFLTSTMWWSYFDAYFSTCIKFSMFFQFSLDFLFAGLFTYFSCFSEVEKDRCESSETFQGSWKSGGYTYISLSADDFNYNSFDFRGSSFEF